MGKSSMLPGMLCRLVVPGSIPLFHPACLQSMAIGALGAGSWLGQAQWGASLQMIMHA